MRNRWRARIISLGRAKPLEEHACYTAEHDKLIVYLTGPTLPIRWILQHRPGISSRNIVQYYNRIALNIGYSGYIRRIIDEYRWKDHIR